MRVFPLALHLPAEPAPGDSAELRLLDRFVDRGGDLLDVGDGRGQSVTGAWLRRRSVRERMLLSCTIDVSLPSLRRPSDAPIGSDPAAPGLIGSSLRRQLDAILRRLQTDHVDLVLLRLSEGDDALDEALLALDEQLRAGRIRAIGGRGTAVQRLVEARVASGQLSLARMAVLQHPYSITDRAAYERDAAAVVEHLGLAALPQVTHQRPSGSRREQRRAARLTDGVREVATQLGADEQTVGLAWLLSKPNVVAPMVTVRSEHELDAALDAAELELSRTQLTELDRLSVVAPGRVGRRRRDRTR